MTEAGGCIVRRDGRDRLADRFKQRLAGARPQPAQERFDLRERLLDGVQSGEYGGRKSSSQSTASIASRMRAAVWTLRLSRMTT